jgi:hypothetical protein
MDLEQQVVGYDERIGMPCVYADATISDDIFLVSTKRGWPQVWMANAKISNGC